MNCVRVSQGGTVNAAAVCKSKEGLLHDNQPGLQIGNHSFVTAALRSGDTYDYEDPPPPPRPPDPLSSEDNHPPMEMDIERCVMKG